MTPTETPEQDGYYFKVENPKPETPDPERPPLEELERFEHRLRNRGDEIIECADIGLAQDERALRKNGNMMIEAADRIASLEAQLAESQERVKELEGLRPNPDMMKERLAEDGFWQPCSGCYETNEGAHTGYYPYDPVFQSYVGSGCSECGGLGMVWDNADYSDFADFSKQYDREQKRIARMETALRKISSPSQTENLLWWQEEARVALNGANNGGEDG